MSSIYTLYRTSVSVFHMCEGPSVPGSAGHEAGIHPEWDTRSQRQVLCTAVPFYSAILVNMHGQFKVS